MESIWNNHYKDLWTTTIVRIPNKQPINNACVFSWLNIPSSSMFVSKDLREVQVIDMNGDVAEKSPGGVRRLNGSTMLFQRFQG